MSCTYRFFFFNDTATTEIYTLSLHDALPILGSEDYAVRNETYGLATMRKEHVTVRGDGTMVFSYEAKHGRRDRKSTRLNSSHANISYAVFCLKKKKKTTMHNNYKQQANHRHT